MTDNRGPGKTQSDGGRSDRAQPGPALGAISPAKVSPWVQLRSASMHPFLYSRMIDSADPTAKPGDIVNVYDRAGMLFGQGIYNPRSKITLRMLAHGESQVNESFWRARLQKAFELRERLGISRETDAYRLVHAEGDGLSGLILERYADCVVFEVFSLGIFQRLNLLTRLSTELLPQPESLDRLPRGKAPWRVVIRADQSVQEMEGFKAPAPQDVGRLIVREHSVRYRVDPAGGQKTGFFCDQRENRKRFAALCRDARVLDLCCYTGGFSLCAMVCGQARDATAVDLDESALVLAKENANLNQVRVHFAHADAFVYLRQLLANRNTFDCVVLDPPKLALSRTQLDEALRKYYDLNTLALQVVREGGFLVTCSCSGLVSGELFRDTVFRAARRASKSVQVLDFTGAGADHPVLGTCPESAYLKVMWLRVSSGM